MVAPKTERSRFRALHRMWRHPLGEVSGGTDASTGARVQVMALNPGSVVSDAVLEAGRVAARVAAGISHPAVIRPVDVQRTPDGRIVIATESLEGTPLTNVSRNQPLPIARTIAILRQLCKALAASHDVGLVHRALTLGSLVLRARAERPDTLAVTDFGIGPLLDGEIAILKEDAALQPVSPERSSGAQQDAREDLYLMGCIAYSLFTGGSPFRTGTPDAVRRRHAIEDPMAIGDRLKGTRGVHPALAAWVHRCLAKEPDDRFEHAADAEAALCLAQIEAHVETPWDDLPVPDADADTMARIIAGLRRKAQSPAVAAAMPEDDVTVLRRASDPSPDDQTTVVHNPEVEAFEPLEEVDSMPIALGVGLGGFDRSETVVTRRDETVSGARPRADGATAIVEADEIASDPEPTRRTAIPQDETAVGPAPGRISAVVEVDPEPEDEIDPWEAEAGDQTQISMAPAMPFHAAAVVSEFEPEPGDRTMIAAVDLVVFSPATPQPLLARPPSSTPTVPAGTPIDPRSLPSSSTTLPGNGSVRESSRPPEFSAPAPVSFEQFEEEEPTMPAEPPAPPSAPPPQWAAPLATAPPAPPPVAFELPPAAQVAPPAVLAAPPAAPPQSRPSPIASPPAQAAFANQPTVSVPASTFPNVMPAGVAPPWPSGPSGLTGQYTSASTAFSGSDMDASMIAAIGGHGRTAKLIAVVVAVAAVVGVGGYFILRPEPPAKPVAAAPVEKAPAPPRVEKPAPVVDDLAADVAATPNDLVAAGDRALAAGRAADAESLYQRAIVREPKYLGALLGLGRLQLAAGDTEKAAGYFRRAVGSSPNDGGARILLGDALAKQGNVTEARKQYKKAKALKHPDAAARLASL